MTTTRNYDKSIPELRRQWDYGRNGDESRAALVALKLRDQLGPDGNPFAWGEVLDRHAIGDITIIESVRDEPIWRDGQHVDPDPNEPHAFHYYIGEHDCGHSCRSLDRAMLEALAYKYEMRPREGDSPGRLDGINRAANSRAASYMARMIGLEDEA